MDYSAFQVERDENMKFTAKHKIIMIGMVITVGTIVYGSLKRGWYINEMSGVFIISGILSSIVGGKRAEGICKDLITSLSEMTVAMVVVGMSRAILVIMQNGVIIDSVIHGMNSLMDGLPAWGTRHRYADRAEHPELLHPVRQRTGGSYHADYDSAG